MILIDTNYVARKIFHREGVPENPNYFRHLVILEIIKIKDTFKKEYGSAIIATDNGSWRKDLIKQYKTTRKKSESNRIANKYNFYEIFYEIINLIKENTNMQVFFKEKTEADDIIAILSKLNGKHLVYSGDKDLLQLIYHNKKDKNRKVDYYDFNKNMFVNKDYETIQNLKNIHILMGDRVDDIPKINWNSETTIKFNKWIYDNYKIEMNNKILNKMLKENNILFNLFEKENKNIKIFKNPRLGKITAKKIIETNSLEKYLESNEILKRNFELNKKIIDLNYIPNEIKDNILLEFQNYKIKFPNNKKLFEYCDIHNLDKLKKIIKKINS